MALHYANLIHLKPSFCGEIEHNQIGKTAICSCPIKLTECVLLLEATALNYSVDYYQNSAAAVILPTHFSQIQILFSYIMQLIGMQDGEHYIRELNLNYNFRRHLVNYQNFWGSPVM